MRIHDAWREQPEVGHCVPTSVAIVATALTGEWHDEAEIIARAHAAGFLTEAGMSSGDGATMLRELGLQARADTEGTLELLERALRDGNGVIVAVDADEVWDKLDDDGPGDPGADHALVLSEIDRTRDLVVLCDPGADDGRAYELPLPIFLEAWDDGANEYIVAEAPEPGWRMWLVRLMRR